MKKDEIKQFNLRILQPSLPVKLPSLILLSPRQIQTTFRPHQSKINNQQSSLQPPLPQLVDGQVWREDEVRFNPNVGKDDFIILQISTPQKKETMKNICVILIVIALLAPATLAATCTATTQADCGLTGTTCQYYTWNNGTCVPVSSCPTSPTVTVWSNSTQNCEVCFGSSSSICASCTAISSVFYYDTNLAACTTCANKYGSSCLTCDSNNCISCSTGLNLTSDKQSCFSGACGITYCTVCASTTACQTCDSTHALVSGFCICQIDNCEVCANGFCTSCSSGYSLDSSKKSCNFICIDYCQSCTNLLSCTLCFTGYYYSSTSNQCLPNCALIDANCISCSSTTICSQCSSNYTLSGSQSSCLAACSDSNCISCLSSPSVCTQCTTGYKVSAYNNCTSDLCEISNCIQCASATTCAQCASLYVLSSTYISCNANCNDSFCIYCSSLTTCQTCTTGYKVSSGKCAPLCTISNCKLCRTSTTCQTCDNGFILSTNSQSCLYNCGILDCITCNSTTTCSACYPGYTLGSSATACIVNCPDGKYQFNNTCVACIDPNCYTCNSNGVCLSCLDLYYLYSNGTCISCSLGASNTSTNCYNCDKATGVCKVCANNYYLDSTSTCTAYGACNVDNCQYCQPTNSTSCISCFSGYTLAANSSSCQQITCPGNQFLSGSTCTCGSKSYLQSGVCVACADTNCLSCTSTSCLSCLSKYYPSGTACIACGDNCDSCDSSGCITCTSGFIKKSGVCNAPPTTQPVSVAHTGNQIICPTGCTTCDLDNSNQVICRVASNGYVIYNGQLYNCDPSCATCSNKPDSNGLFTKCLTCPVGANFIAGICTMCTGLNALTCRSKNLAYSLTCIPGYTAEKGICNACTANCLKCSSVGSLAANPQKQNVCDLGGCVQGYFQAKSQSACLKCFNGCQVCGSDPNFCIECGDYKYLLNNACYSCSSNCVKCTSSGCKTCDIGYLVASDGTCKQPNVDGCVNYTAAITCQGCDVNYDLNNGLCVLSMACNADKSCTNCKYNYYLTNGSCSKCPTINNCKSCKLLDSTKCSDCDKGYYLDSTSVCTQCPQSGCLDCSSATQCTTATDGYYLLYDITGKNTGKVKPCKGYCATCQLDSLSCLSCVSGATLYGSLCLSNNYKGIKFVGNLKTITNSTAVTQDFEVGSAIVILGNFLDEMAKALGFSSLGEFLQNTNFKSLKRSSVGIDFSVNSDSLTVDPNSKIVGTSFSDMTLLSLDVVNANSSISNVNLGLVLGVSVPLGILLVAIIVILKVKSSKTQDDQSGLDGTEKGIQYVEAQQF